MVYNGIWLIHKKEWAADSCNMKESQNNYAKWKESDKIIYCLVPFMWNSRKSKLLYSYRKLTSCCLGIGVAGKDGREKLQRAQGNFWWWWMCSLSCLWCWLHRYTQMIKHIKWYSLGMCNLSYVNYLSMTLENTSSALHLLIPSVSTASEFWSETPGWSRCWVIDSLWHQPHLS